MLHFSRTKIIAILFVCLAGILTTLPNLLPKATVDTWPDWVPHKQLSLGLDLKGGAHLLLEMDTKELLDKWLRSVREESRGALLKAGIKSSAGVRDGAVHLTLANPAEADKALSELKKLITPIGNAILGTSGNNYEVDAGASPGTFIVKPTEQAYRERLTNAVGAAVEVIRRRIDSLGNVEANIVRQGADRVLVQVPGFEDTKALKRLIGQTASLSFHEVHPTISAEEALATRVPYGYVIIREDEANRGSQLIKENEVVSGEDLVDAQPGFDQRTNEPIISFRFNQAGARKFGRFTQSHVGQPFAIVLDNGKDESGKRDIRVLSAPVIREPILGGSGQISGSFTVQTANELAVKIRSGALPTSLTIVEERTVGASLGEDSIEAGEWAAVVGTMAVAFFMLFAYGLFGIFSLIAVFLNLVLIVGVMSTLGSTLTLPGIAGLVLTVGMAVDANVLIYERIREELRNGKTSISAIESGFNRAFTTILDSNLTTLIAGLVMFWLGAGPVRGFAVTLSLGIFATVFTAFTVTRLLVSLWIARQKSRKIPAPL
ncbi:MAG: protein translocase subunit SecD [Hyphomicrobiaceae bacterium]|nr:protein translocase subunit SecD [Hyphomicrobiaceae bacterium]MCC0010609.1 protein translocase subunit SecD [Hyphomicrobiaceae bacterium]